MEHSASDVWASGAAYEPYVGRWSRLVAREFLNWLAVPARGRWLDVGCGTGASPRPFWRLPRPTPLWESTLPSLTLHSLARM